MNDQPSSTRRSDAWSSGATYEPYVGRWSRLVAREFVGWLRVPDGARWLDVGCGTGALTETILKVTNPAAVQGIDHSSAYIEFAREQIADPRVRFEVGDAQALPADSGGYDAVVSGLALNFIPDRQAALREMTRAAQPGGVVAAYVWDYADGMQLMRHFWDAAVALHANALELDEGRRFPICKPDALTALFRESGLKQVEVRSIDVPTHFRDFEDYWSPFLGGQGPAPSFVMSLSEQERTNLGDYIHARLPVNADGSIDLTARAWAVRGVAPRGSD